jgi:flagellar hook-associated protein 3 FlgL
MRVANKSIYDMIKMNLANITDDLNKASLVIATGKRIVELSDDPVGLTQVLNIKSTLSNIKQLGRNINLGKSWLSSSESALSNVQNLISDTKALTVQMASANTGAAQRASSAVTIQNTLEEIISLANSEVGGRHIFAGSQTDTIPFTLSGSSVTYNGDDTGFTIRIDRNASLRIGHDGEDIFRPSGSGANDDIFQTLSDLKTALEGNNVSGIQTAMTKLDDHFDHISKKISDIGSKARRMEIKESIFQDMNISNTDRLSSLEDADIIEAIINLKAKELTYQAALTSSARMMQLSLVDYL